MSFLFVATRKGLFVYTVQDTTVEIHSEHFLGDPVSSVAVDDAGHWFAALNLGHFGPKMHKSTDLGKSWNEMACPAFPDKPSDSEDTSDWQVKQVWVMEPVPNEAGRIIVGTIPGAIFETKDGSQTWALNDDLWNVPERTKWFGGGFDESGVHSIAIHPDEPNSWTAAISVGGIWHSGNYGENWTLKCAGMRADYMPEDMQDADDLQDPHRLVQSPSVPKRMWVQHHCGIFVSEDSGKNWTECRPNNDSSFGFAVVVHPTDANTAWFVPGIKDESRYPKDGALKVLKTTDGGKSFIELTDGLPQANCYDLIYRHAVDLDEKGEKLFMGSTTGNLWISYDSGEHWKALNNYLPPIYAVKFIL